MVTGSTSRTATFSAMARKPQKKAVIPAYMIPLVWFCITSKTNKKRRPLFCQRFSYNRFLIFNGVELQNHVRTLKGFFSSPYQSAYPLRFVHRL